MFFSTPNQLMALALLSLSNLSAWALEPSKPAHAGDVLVRERLEDVCTQAPRSEWLPEAEMKLLAEYRGYRISRFKVANGSCYEVYGFKGGVMVEAYFDPVTSKLVRQNVAR